MEQFIYAIAAAALAGLTVLAYRHPNVYRQLCTTLVFIGAWTLIWITASNIGSIKSWISAQNFISQPKLAEAGTAFRDGLFDTWFWIILYFVYLTYLVFLYFLPALIEADKDQGVKNKGD